MRVGLPWGANLRGMLPSERWRTRRLAVWAAALLLAALSGPVAALTQTRTAGSCASVAGIGSVAWSNPGDAVSNDDVYASATVDGTITNYLQCTSYGLSIPTGATIEGITVNVERKSSRTQNGGSQDAAMRIIKGGVVGTVDRSSGTVYTTADATEPHGGATDLWGETWTAADINAANFGAAFAATKPDPGGLAHTITVDVVEITISYTPAPAVVSMVRADSDPTSAASVRWTVTFDQAVTGVDSGDFALVPTGAVSGAAISSVSGSGTTYTVTASTGTGNGTLGLDLVDNDSIVNSFSNPLGATGSGNGNFTGQVYAVEHPVALSLLRADPDPSDAASVRWTVTFNQSVTGVDSSDFALAQSGLSGASITSVTGSGATFTVTASTGVGNGTLGLNLVDDDSIVNSLGDPLAGVGAANGNATGEVYTVSRVSAFNVVEPSADPATGRIFTKIAGQSITVDIVALDASNAIKTSFIGAVKAELVDNSSGGACAGLPLVKALADETFAAGDNGRRPLSAGQFEAEARPNLLFRIKYPAASPTVISCSSDAFANRPWRFVNVVAQDQDRTTAGTTRTLNNTANPGGGDVHNTGRPFRIEATAENAAGATTTLYAPGAGQPVAVLSQCGGGVPAACVPPAALGTLNLGAWSAGSGVITTTTASYNEVGAFDLVLEDRTFAAVDAGDGTATAVRYISSASTLTVGRFVPDHFAIVAGATITPRSDIPACSGSSFTYLGERLDLVFTLEARNSAGAVTQNYTGALAALALNNAASYSFGAIDSAAPTPLTGRLDLSLIPGIAATWAAGVAAITAPIAIARAATPDGPFASVKIGIVPSDLDGVTIATLDLDADNDATMERAQVGAASALRFGRLRLENAVGSEKLDLPIPIQVQFWSGTAFQVNSADNCTSLTAANLALGDYIGGIDATNMASGNISLGGAFAAGAGSLALTKPTPVPASAGAVTVTVNLTAEAKSYLKGNWGVATYTADPRSRAAFGLFGSQPRQFIYFRENY